MSAHADILTVITTEIFAALDLPQELARVTVSDRPDLAQFQCNGAMGAARVAKKNPREIAAMIVSELEKNDIFSKIEIAGPGFINLDVTDSFLENAMADLSQDERCGLPLSGNNQTIVLDYGGPNIAKPMHVGHLRAAIIGDSIRRMMKFAGFETLGDVHMGDWGTHMGMIISEFIRTGQTEDILATDLSDEAQIDDLMKTLGTMYPLVAAACREDEARKEEAREATVKLQNKEAPYYDLLNVIKAASVNGMRRNYDSLGVHFDLWKGESDVHDYIAPMVEDLKAQNLAMEDDEALIVPVANDDDKKEIPPLLLYKRDGGVMYGTTDLATIVERVKLYDPARIIYVVDQRQHLHFEQVFRVSQKGGITKPEVELTHAGFGTMNGPDGKPFKTRAGGVMRLEDLIEMAQDKAMERLGEAALAQDMNEGEKAEVAHKVAIAAIKFADLSNPRLSDYVFDLDKLTSFEGKTGPYILYQTVRIQSLLRKAAFDESAAMTFKIHEGDRALALLLGAFPEAFEASLKQYMPHNLCDYAYRLASAFSRFYGNHHMMSEPDEALRQSRLALCALTHKQLVLALSFLGITVPDRM